MDEISDWTHDLARRLHVRAPVETRELRRLFAAEDFAGLVGAIKSSFALEVRMELGRVHSGGCPTAPAWISLPKPMPLYGTEAFRRTTLAGHGRAAGANQRDGRSSENELHQRPG